LAHDIPGRHRYFADDLVVPQTGCSINHSCGAAHRQAHCQHHEELVEAHDVKVLELRDRVADEDRERRFVRRAGKAHELQRVALGPQDGVSKLAQNEAELAAEAVLLHFEERLERVAREPFRHVRQWRPSRRNLPPAQ
jgi:hypothetical protein